MKLGISVVHCPSNSKQAATTHYFPWYFSLKPNKKAPKRNLAEHLLRWKGYIQYLHMENGWVTLYPCLCTAWEILIRLLLGFRECFPFSARQLRHCCHCRALRKGWESMGWNVGRLESIGFFVPENIEKRWYHGYSKVIESSRGVQCYKFMNRRLNLILNIYSFEIYWNSRHQAIEVWLYIAGWSTLGMSYRSISYLTYVNLQQNTGGLVWFFFHLQPWALSSSTRLCSEPGKHLGFMLSKTVTFSLSQFVHPKRKFAKKNPLKMDIK